VAGPLLEASADEFRQQLEVNLVAPMVVIKAFAPLLGTDRTLTGPPGRIVNISSVGGRFAAPFVGLYAASKHGLEGLSDSLRRELMLYGIDTDMGQGRANRPGCLSDKPLFRGHQALPRLHDRGRPQGMAARALGRGRVRGFDGGAAQGALLPGRRKISELDAAADPADAGRGPHHRQDLRNPPFVTAP
jgi:hypothetical protein